MFCPRGWTPKQRPLAEVTARLDAQQHRRFIKTHTPLDGLPVVGSCTYLCVARDPRDVVISAYYAYLNVNVDAVLEAQRAAGALAGDTPGPAATAPRPDFPTWFGWWVNSPPPPANPVGSLTGLCAHLRTSWEQRDASNVILVHYRNLEQHLESEMRRIADALGITVDDTAWASLVRAAGFEAMRSRADELVPEVHVPGHLARQPGVLPHRDERPVAHTALRHRPRPLPAAPRGARYRFGLSRLAS